MAVTTHYATYTPEDIAGSTAGNGSTDCATAISTILTAGGKVRFRMRSLLIVLLAFGFSLISVDAVAQCGATVSQCRQCHEIDKRHPVLADGRPWHKDHAFGDFCVACHGGDGTATDSAVAHDGLMSPLRAYRITCGTAMCHGSAAEELAARYKALAPPAAPLPAVATAAAAPVAGPPSVAPTAPPNHDRAAAVVAAALALLGSASVWWNERRRRAAEVRS